MVDAQFGALPGDTWEVVLRLMVCVVANGDQDREREIRRGVVIFTADLHDLEN